MTECKSCSAPVFWIKTSNGKNMLLNAKPEKRFIVDGDPEGFIVPDAVMKDTYVSHFATCPQSKKWRKK